PTRRSSDLRTVCWPTANNTSWVRSCARTPKTTVSAPMASSGPNSARDHQEFRCDPRRPAGVWQLLHRMGWTNQLPAHRVVKRDEDAITQWVEHTWPKIEKGGPKTGRGSALRMSQAPY